MDGEYEMDGEQESETEVSFKVNEEVLTEESGTDETQSLKKNNGNSEEDANEINMAEEEGRILRVIRMIKDKRKKACYQSILDFACRENNLLNMAVCKYIVNDLVKRNILVNIGRNKNRNHSS